MRQRHIDMDVVGQFAVLMPVLVDMDVGTAFAGEPKLIQYREPLGGIEEDDIGLGGVQGLPGRPECRIESCPARHIRS
ncbi:hypothetical protein D9M69_615230 [compost metagenome]